MLVWLCIHASSATHAKASLPSRYINRLHYRKPCEPPAKRLKSFLPLTDFVLYSITQNQISLSAKSLFKKATAKAVAQKIIYLKPF